MQRVTAAWMGKGLGGWKFPRVEYEKGKRLAIVIMTTQKHRPDGHVGVALEDVYDGSTIVAQASSRYGFITMIVERDEANRLKMYMKQTTGG